MLPARSNSWLLRNRAEACASKLWAADARDCSTAWRLTKPKTETKPSSAMGEAEVDYFAALGLPRLLTLDPAELDLTYHELGRRIHPDRFANQSAAVKAASLKGTALLTRSYRTLKDPVARGLYWLELHGQ